MQQLVLSVTKSARDQRPLRGWHGMILLGSPRPAGQSVDTFQLEPSTERVKNTGVQEIYFCTTSVKRVWIQNIKYNGGGQGELFNLLENKLCK